MGQIQPEGVDFQNLINKYKITELKLSKDVRELVVKSLRVFLTNIKQVYEIKETSRQDYYKINYIMCESTESIERCLKDIEKGTDFTYLKVLADIYSIVILRTYLQNKTRKQKLHFLNKLNSLKNIEGVYWKKHGTDLKLFMHKTIDYLDANLTMQQQIIIQELLSIVVFVLDTYEVETIFIKYVIRKLETVIINNHMTLLTTLNIERIKVSKIITSENNIAEEALNNSEMYKEKKGKLCYSLIRPDFLEVLTEVLEYGAKKYKKDSWKLVPASDYFDAFLRHSIELQKGNIVDNESKLLHIGHLAANLMFLQYFIDNGKWPSKD